MKARIYVLVAAILVVVAVSVGTRVDGKQITVTSGTLSSSSFDIGRDLDQEPFVSCKGWNYKTKQPFGCAPRDEWTLDVTFNKKPYKLTRLELREAVERQIAKGKR